jgi:hypothetical protein
MLVGHGIDAAVEGPYRPVAIASREVGLGDDICVRSTDYNLATVCGKFRGFHGLTPHDPSAYILVERNSGLRLVSVSTVQAIEVETTGYGWAYGGAAGLLLDVAVFVVHDRFVKVGWNSRDSEEPRPTPLARY